MEVIPKHAPGEAFTGRVVTGETVTGGCFVSVDADLSTDEAGALQGSDTPQGYPTVGHNAGVACLGVAARDRTAGQAVTIWGPGHVLRVIAGAAIDVTAAQQLECDASGRVIPLAAGVPVARAMSDAAGADAVVLVQVL